MKWNYPSRDKANGGGMESETGDIRDGGTWNGMERSLARQDDGT